VYTRRVLASYQDKLQAFSPNARNYLYSTAIAGAATGIYRLLFNFFILSVGFDERMLGNMITASSLSILLFALPMGFLTGKFGRKQALIISQLLVSASVLGTILFPYAGVILGLNVVLGMGQSLSAVSLGPFLMENSREKERTYLFSFSFGIRMASDFVGNWMGGFLPLLIANLSGNAANSSYTYAAALIIVVIMNTFSVLPLFRITKDRISDQPESNFASPGLLLKEKKLYTILILPMLITSIGAGLITPFMNVFFRNVHQLSDHQIGTIFAIGALATGIGFMIAPALADRIGKIQIVVLTQVISIPFLFILGFSPWLGFAVLAYYIRGTLMNMSGPIYQSYVLEKVPPESRATIASLTSMAGNFGFAISPTISGMLQVSYGFAPAFAGTILLYTLSTFMYWAFFIRPERK
jgi:MFS family permease